MEAPPPGSSPEATHLDTQNVGEKLRWKDYPSLPAQKSAWFPTAPMTSHTLEANTPPAASSGHIQRSESFP